MSKIIYVISTSEIEAMYDKLEEFSDLQEANRHLQYLKGQFNSFNKYDVYSKETVVRKVSNGPLPSL